MKYTLQASILLLLCSGLSQAQSIAQDAINAFASKTGARTSVDKATSAVGFIRFPANRPYSTQGTSAREKALNFVRENASVYGIRSDRDLYLVRSEETDNIGLQHVTLQQTLGGVPIYDGVLKFHFDRRLDIASVNGNFISTSKLKTTPVLTGERAGELALRMVDGQNKNQSGQPVVVKKSTLYVFQKGLAQGYDAGKYLVYEVEVANGVDVREFLFVDAHTGQLVEQFTGMHAIDRELYNQTYTPANRIWKEGDAFPGSLNSWQQSEIESAGHMYNMMKNAFARTSYNGLDAKMITTHNNPSIACPNANWNGVSANYCDQTAADDVVAHEWGHAYTEYTSGLIYGFQAGALNESFSDIWGETVDQLNNYMDDPGDNGPRTNACNETSKRWKMGEKATAFGGAIRDMYNPNCNSHPGRVNDPFYHCSTSDAGGVHLNSGVNNHAYALLVDGGTYNGQTINGIGLTKAAHIFWRAQSSYLTHTSDFSVQADALEAAAADLIAADQELQALSTGAPAGSSGLKITAEDAAELAKVLLAVEMRAEPLCPFTTLLKPAPDLCAGASNPATKLYSEDFEDGLAGWAVLSIPEEPAQFTPRNWVAKTNAPNHPGTAAYAANPNSGNCSAASGYETGLMRLESPVIAIPAGTGGDILMAFNHYVATEAGFDGGNIKFSIDGGAWTLLPASAFTANGYNLTLATTSQGNTNPLQSQVAFSGTDEASYAGTWGQSQINLSAAGVGLTAGHNIQFRWELGTDICTGMEGWYIDDIQIYSCAAPAVHFADATSTVNESQANVVDGCLNYMEKTVAVVIDKAPSQPVTVTFATAGTATKGLASDYSISPASVVLSADNLSQNVVVRVYNDAYVESDETVILTYSLSGGGDAYAGTTKQSHQLTISDNDVVPAVGATIPVYAANFDNNMEGWQVTNGGNTIETWHRRGTYFGSTLNSTPFLFADSDGPANQAVTLNESVESPAINTAGMKGLKLTYKQFFRRYNGGFNEQAITQVWDGTTWQEVKRLTQSSGSIGAFGSPNLVTIDIPDAYANPNLKIRFIYQANYDYYWAIDDVALTRVAANQVQSAVAQSNAQYLGPNQTAYFYGPSENLIAKIENTSAHDYGCTTVEVDRAGSGSTSWVGPWKITNKTFKVTPATNNPAGTYNITLYYTSAELTGFSGDQITSMGKSPGSIGAGNTVATSFAETRVSQAYASDLAYTATFDSGFSGFGLSDAPPAGALPVTLVKFDGAYTTEGNRLNWTTTAEVNNDYFAVEQSADGRTFKTIGTVKGEGNTSAAETNYTFLDVNHPKGISYYRLKQVDRDGTSAYSKKIAIDAPTERELKFFPNPVQSLLTMELPGVTASTVGVKVVNTAGQTVLDRGKVVMKTGAVQVDMSKLPKGIYQVIVTGGGTSRTVSIAKL